MMVSKIELERRLDRALAVLTKTIAQTLALSRSVGQSQFGLPREGMLAAESLALKEVFCASVAVYLELSETQAAELRKQVAAAVEPYAKEALADTITTAA